MVRRNIKRYANRKLYDTEASRYVTLDDVATMIKEGDDVRVKDKESGQDLTPLIFAQIIFAEEKKVAKMPLVLLRGMVQSGGEAIGGLVQNWQKKLDDRVHEALASISKLTNMLPDFARLKNKVKQQESRIKALEKALFDSKRKTK